jgi:hypothetical protein
MVKATAPSTSRIGTHHRDRPRVGNAGGAYWSGWRRTSCMVIPSGTVGTRLR